MFPQLDLWSRSRSLQRKVLEKARKRAGDFGRAILPVYRIAAAERTPLLQIGFLR